MVERLPHIKNIVRVQIQAVADLIKSLKLVNDSTDKRVLLDALKRRSRVKGHGHV